MSVPVDVVGTSAVVCMALVSHTHKADKEPAGLTAYVEHQAGSCIAVGIAAAF
jgi:hypothetical protein